MATLRYMFVCLCNFFLVYSEFQTEIRYPSLDRELTAVLNYLNSQPYKIYNYHRAIPLVSQTKGDIIELQLEVRVDCINNYPDVPCTVKALTCTAYVQTTPEGATQVLNDVDCKPEPQVIAEDVYYNDNPTEVNETKSIALSNEAVSSEVGERFVAVRRDMMPCVGCPFDLDVNAEGVDELIDIALEHVGSERDKKQALVKVLRLQQQVVSGITYYLVVEIAPTVCLKNQPLESCPIDSTIESSICQVVFLQKPWISRTKYVIGNNCTQSQEYVKPQRSDLSNEIDSNDNKRQNSPNFDHMAASGTIEQMTPSRLSDLESQIILDFVPEKSPEVSRAPTETVVLTDEQMTPSRLSDLESQILDFAEAPTTTEVEESKRENTEEPRNDASEDTSSGEDMRDGRTKRSQESSESDERGSNSTISELRQASNSSEENSSEEVKPRARRSEESVESEERAANLTVDASQAANSSEENSSEEKPRARRAIPQLEKISPEEKGLVRNLADFAAAALDSIDDDNHRRIILQILGAKKMVGDDGIYYHLIMRMGISRCLEDKAPTPYENCREKLIENYTKICKVQVYVSDDITTPKIVKSQCQNIKKDKNDSNRTNYSRFRRAPRREVLVGGQTEVSKDSDNVKELLRLGLNHLNAQSSKSNKYKSVDVVSATSQVVAGSLYRIKVKVLETDCSKTDQRDLEDCNVVKGETPTICEVEVWEKSWQNFRKFTIKCENGENHNIETTISRRKRSLPGGESEIAKDDEDVLTLLDDALTHLDSESSHENKYKIQEVLSAKSQVVSGQLYRIKAKIVESDCKKTAATKRHLCGINSDSHPKTCNFVVHDQPWLPNGRLTNISCEGETHSFRLRREVGGHRGVDGDDEFVEKYIESGLRQLDEESLYENKFKVDQIMSVTKQTVAGHVYHITARVVLSNCKKGEIEERKMCGTLEGAEPQICKFRVFEALWKRNSRTINVTCDNGEYTFLTQHRGLLGNDNRTVQWSLFTDFLMKYDKKYTTKEEYKYRFKVFTDNLLRIRLLNTYEQATAWYGVTKFSDLTQEEFSKSLGLRTDLRSENEPPFAQAEIPKVELPTEFDWRDKGAVTEVKDQQQCGSCWAFSVTGNVEGQYAIKKGKLLEFSEQELVDCDTDDQGCNGGLMDNAYRQIEKLGGLETEQDYPYDAEDEKCHFNRSLARVQLSGALNISHNETDMAKWLVANGPISIAINANAMQFYMGGVSHPLKFLCSPKSLDHGVLIVGYGVHTYPLFKKTLPYWIVKNSWGKSWGEQGYYRVYRGDGTCGLNQTPSSAIVA